MTDFMAQRRRALAQLFTLLGLGLFASCFAAYLLLGPSVVAGWIVGFVGLALVVFAVAGFHRFPTRDHYARYKPGELGSTRGLAWSLAFFSQLPFVIALTVLWDR
jgi:FtsH-binding integral membrane protein